MSEPARVVSGVGARDDSAESLRRTVLRSAVWRFGALVTAAACSFPISKLLIGHYGPGTFGAYALVSTLIAMVPFLDLGVGTLVINALAAPADPGASERVRGVLLSSFRVVLASALVVVAATVALGRAHLWPDLLGISATSGVTNGEIVAGLCLFSLALPFSLGQRILLGVGKNHVQIICQGIQTPAALAFILVVVFLSLPRGLTVVCAFAAVLASAMLSQALAVRLAGLDWRYYLRAIFRPSIRGQRVLAAAGPAFLVSALLPLAVQSDRLVLSHFSTTRALAEYSLGAQIFTPIAAVVAAAGQSLWPRFAEARARGERPHLIALVGSFGAVAAVASALLAVCAPVIVDYVAGGQIKLGGLTLLAFCLVNVAVAVQYPLGIWLTDPAGLRFQAFMVALALPVNVGLSIALAKPAGAAGPVLATAAAILALQGVPYAIVARHRARPAARVMKGRLPQLP